MGQKWRLSIEISHAMGLGGANHVLTGPMGAVTSDVAIAMAEGVLNLMGGVWQWPRRASRDPLPRRMATPLGCWLWLSPRKGRHRRLQRKTLQTAAWTSLAAAP